MITNQMTLSLIDVVKEKEELRRLQGYWNTYPCQRVIYMADGKLYGRYCKNRHCLLCLAIRKAAIINRCLPTISLWPDPHMGDHYGQISSPQPNSQTNSFFT
jgi:hypothetical protein